MIHFIKAFFSFLFKSTNQHGVHSPFIYKLVTKCFYDKTKYDDYSNIKNNKKHKLLYRLVKYLKAENILEVEVSLNTVINIANPKAKIMSIKNEDVIPNEKFDIIYINEQSSNNGLNLFKNLINCTHNNSVIILNNIHKTKTANNIWDDIKNHPKTTVTIDIFFWGLVFFRTEQVKEDFIIRV